MSPAKPKIILDTDIGDDIDDAFALLLMVESGHFDVLGVTTVFRNAEKRAKMASYLLASLKKDVKVYPGCDIPLITTVEKIVSPEIRAKEKKDPDGKYHLPQYDGKMDGAKIESVHAVDFIIESVHRHPYEVTLVPIGPYTNIALAIRKDPSIVPLIKEIRIMGGGLNQNFSEWNVWCDPEAAYILFTSGVKLSTVGLNVTMQTALDKSYIEEMKASQSKPILLVYEMMMKWFEHYQFASPVMHDPLTIASLIDPNILTFEEKRLVVSLKESNYGFVLEDERSPYVASYASQINKTRFFDLFRKVIFGTAVSND